MNREDAAAGGSAAQESTDPAWARFDAKAFAAHVCKEIGDWAKVIIPFLDATALGPKSIIEDGGRLPASVLQAENTADSFSTLLPALFLNSKSDKEALLPFFDAKKTVKVPSSAPPVDTQTDVALAIFRAHFHSIRQLFISIGDPIRQNHWSYIAPRFIDGSTGKLVLAAAENPELYWLAHAQILTTASTVYFALVLNSVTASRIANDVRLLDALAWLVVSSGPSGIIAGPDKSYRRRPVPKSDKTMDEILFQELESSVKCLFLPLSTNPAPYAAAYPLIDSGDGTGIKFRECPAMHAFQFAAHVLEGIGQEASYWHKDLLLSIEDDVFWLEALLTQDKYHADTFMKQLGRQGRETRKGAPDRCDSCDRTATEAGYPEGKLKRCGRCKVAMYCSTDCSKGAWKEGHKAVCFQAGK